MRRAAPPAKLPDEFMDLAEAFAEWLGQMGYAASSCKGMARQAASWLAWLTATGITEYTEVTQPDIEAYAEHLHEVVSERTSRGLSSKTIEARLAVVRRIDEYRERLGLERVVKGMPRVEHGEPTRRRLLAQTEVERLYAAFPAGARGQYIRCVLGLYYGCGLRAGEGIRLRIGEVDLRGGMLLVARAKNLHQRYVPLSAGVKADLQSWLTDGRARYAYAQCDRVLLNRLGGPIGAPKLNRDLRALCDEAGVAPTITLHSLRHSIATHLSMGGISLEAVARFLGHRHTKSTQVYVRLAAELGQQEAP